MRAKFSVTISARKDGSRPDNDDFLKPVRANGWGLIDIETIDAEPERQKRYDEEAAKLWGEMPEVCHRTLKGGHGGTFETRPARKAIQYDRTAME